MTNWRRTRILPWWVVCFLLGIVTADRTLLHFYGFLFTALIITGFFVRFRWRLLYYIFGFFIGWAWGSHAFAPPEFALEFPKEKATYDLVITGPVQFVREGVRVDADLLTDRNEERTVPIRLIVYEGVPKLHTGDRVRVRGKIKPVSGFRNPDAMDAVRQAEREGIYWTIRVNTAASVAVLDRAPGWWPTRWIEEWRLDLRNRLVGAWSPRPQLTSSSGGGTPPLRPAPIIRGITLGDRSGISENQYENFRRSGLTHLLAISGQHVGLVALLFYLLARGLLSLVPSLGLWVPLPKLAWLTAWIPVSAYVVMAGAPVSACRAWMMLSCFLAAFLWDQCRDAVTTLALAALLLVLWHPAELFTLSFHLSFLAVAVLIVCVSGTNRSWWGRMVSVAIASFFVNLLLALPLAHAFGELFFAGLIANLLALPLFSFWVLPGALGSVFLAPFWPQLAQFILHFTTWGTAALNYIAHYFAALDWSLPLRITTVQLVTCGLVLLAYQLYPLRWLVYRPFVLLGAALVLASLSYGETPRANRLSMTLLDVGQGDAIVLSIDGERYYLIDGGGFYIPHDRRDFPVIDVGENVIGPYLLQSKIDHLDGVILSHPHPDHYEGLLWLAQHWRIKNFYWNGDAFNDSQYAYLMEALERQATRFHVIDRDSPGWEAGTLKWQWLNPSADTANEFNDRSIVLRIDYGAICILLTGDIEAQTEYRMTGDGLAPCDIVKVPHHGSRTSSTGHFLDQVQPQLALISVGRGNPFGHPHPEVVARYAERGISVRRTDRNGAITIETDGKKIWVETVAPTPPYPNFPTTPPSNE